MGAQSYTALGTFAFVTPETRCRKLPQRTLGWLDDFPCKHSLTNFKALNLQRIYVTHQGLLGLKLTPPCQRWRSRQVSQLLLV